MKRLPRTVTILGIVSLLTGFSREMTYPLLPLFLVQLQCAPPWVLSVMEGVAESTDSLLKLVSGCWTDRLRFVGRVGKGVRTSHRDALVAGVAPASDMAVISLVILVLLTGYKAHGREVVA